MEKKSKKTAHEEKIFLETEKEIKNNIDELLVWLGGSVNYFVRSIKELSNVSKEKDIFRSYVTERLFDCISPLGEIADIFAPEDYNEEDAEFREKLEKSLLGIDINPDDLDEIGRYYASQICGIMSLNYDEFLTMRLHVSALKFISKHGNDLGSKVLDFLCDHIMRVQHLPMEKKIANLLFLIMAVREIPDTLLGDYAEDINSILDKASLTVCMSVTNDFINSRRKDED